MRDRYNNMVSVDVFWKWYYLLNNIWFYGNMIMILPFIIACVRRFCRRALSTELTTDYLPRFCLIFSWCFYVVDIFVKYRVDGGESICQKAFFIHHVTSLFILPPIFLAAYVPWWVGPVGFVHGFALYFPAIEWINYIYALTLFIFHYGIYQQPYVQLKYYRLLHLAINGVWVFALLLLLGDCSNFLPLTPD